MRMMKKIAALLMSAALLCPSFTQPRAKAAEISDLTYAGVDVSSAIALEKSGVVFRDRQGEPSDLFAVLKDAGVNLIRVRIWNQPATNSGVTYGGGANDVSCAVEIAKRCEAVGLSLLVDFHYSDFWADPGKQKAPKAWENYNVAQKADAIYHFTKDSLQKIGATGAKIEMVQVGNETTSGMCGVLLDSYNWSDAGWRDVCSLFSAGSKAVREYDKNIRVAVHFTNPEKSGHYAYLAGKLAMCNVDYDVFASSYYPYWHGTLSNLQSVLNEVANKYQKDVMVAETSWAYSYDDTDFYRNTIGNASALGNYVKYDVSVNGQTQFLTDLFRTVANTNRGIGVCYWEPAWLTVGGDYNGNLQKWERDGSGWATKAAQEYDESAWEYGGSSVENQALFSPEGKPLDSLYVFRQITGDNGGAPSQSTNLLKNGGFEADGGWTDAPSGWKRTSTVSGSGHFDVRAEDVYAGGCALHWYAEQAFSGCVLETSVQVPEDGVYAFSAVMQGNDNSTMTLRLQNSANGTEQSTVQQGKGWSEWQNPSVELAAKCGDTLTVQILVDGAMTGQDTTIYGSADDCKLVRVGDIPAESTTTSTTTTTTTTTTETTTTTTTTTTSTTTSTTTTKTDLPAVIDIMGDANCDGLVTVSDAILTCRAALEDLTVDILWQGRQNADCDKDGALTSLDVSLILKCVAKLITL